MRPAVAERAREPVPARGLGDILPHRKAVAIDLADQRHRGRVLGVVATRLLASRRAVMK